jgi:hypothetical protein
MRLTIQLLAVVFVLGCAKKEAPAPSSSGQSVAVAGSHAQTASEAASPMGAAPAAAPGGFQGKVVETLDSAGYTYMKLATADGEKWAAVRAAKVSVGQQATVVGAVEMRGFESKTLNRKFDSIWFGSMGADPAAAGASSGPDPQAAMQAMAAQHAAVATGPGDAGDVKVPKAEGADARTVAEVFAKKAELKDKSVTVRGKVVKALSGIMGKNWVHLRDGSGSAEKKDFDLTVTTNQMAAVGDVVVIKGTVHLDRDFGAGYAYPVIVEEATITK